MRCASQSIAARKEAISMKQHDSSVLAVSLLDLAAIHFTVSFTPVGCYHCRFHHVAVSNLPFLFLPSVLCFILSRVSCTLGRSASTTSDTGTVPVLLSIKVVYTHRTRSFGRPK